MPRAKPWTLEEDVLLRKLINEELSFKQIEERTGISKSRAHKRAVELNISWGHYKRPSRLKVNRQIREGILKGEEVTTLSERLGVDARRIRSVRLIMYKEDPDLKKKLYRKRMQVVNSRRLTNFSKDTIEEINAYWRAKGMPYRAWWDFEKKKIVSDIPTSGIFHGPSKANGNTG